MTTKEKTELFNSIELNNMINFINDKNYISCKHLNFTTDNFKKYLDLLDYEKYPKSSIEYLNNVLLLNNNSNTYLYFRTINSTQLIEINNANYKNYYDYKHAFNLLELKNLCKSKNNLLDFTNNQVYLNNNNIKLLNFLKILKIIF